jgi:hypothetical protein
MIKTSKTRLFTITNMNNLENKVKNQLQKYHTSKTDAFETGSRCSKDIVKPNTTVRYLMLALLPHGLPIYDLQQSGLCYGMFLRVRARE